jgi:3-oxoacyl-[acyl-carrier-protein] synthase II
MNILGIGVLFARGTGIGRWESALRDGWRMPEEVDSPSSGTGKRLAYRVNLDDVPDRTLLKKIRRADKLSKMAVVAASGALADGGIGGIDGKRLGVVLATAFGAHVTTFDFLDGILDYGDANVSPTAFSNSVHNAAASYVSSSLDIRGPTLTVTQFRLSFPLALQLATAWLDQGRCDHVLVGAAEQYGEVLGYVSGRMLEPASDGRIRPFAFRPARHVPGEGAAFFLLGREPSGNAYCSIDGVRFESEPVRGGRADIDVIDADGMQADESAYRSFLDPDVPVAAYSPLVGSLMTGGAFNVAAAALMLSRRFHFAAPVRDNPHGLRLLEETRPARVESIRCLGCDCRGTMAAVRLGAIKGAGLHAGA